MQFRRSLISTLSVRFTNALIAAPLAALLFACNSTPKRVADPLCPVAGGVNANELIREGETHFANLWRLTWDGQNAEAYWNPAGDRLVYQRHWEDVGCDRIFVTDPERGIENQISDGRGTTTCSYFMPDGEHVLFGSTGAIHTDCPPKPPKYPDYTWAIYPEFEIYEQDLATGETRPFITAPGYDAEATVSPTGDRIVFTSLRTGDPELWTCDLSGGDLRQVTDELGYDGGAFFSHDGEWLVFRSTEFDESQEKTGRARYKELIAQNLIKPGKMEIVVVRADGSERRQVTHLGEANWAPYFFPDDKRILFCSNHHSPLSTGMMNFDLFAIDVDGTNLERITFAEEFDSFPMFSPDGRYLVFASNRGELTRGDTNLFIAEWR